MAFINNQFSNALKIVLIYLTIAAIIIILVKKYLICFETLYLVVFTNIAYFRAFRKFISFKIGIIFIILVYEKIIQFFIENFIVSINLKLILALFLFCILCGVNKYSTFYGAQNSLSYSNDCCNNYYFTEKNC